MASDEPQRDLTEPKAATDAVSRPILSPRGEMYCAALALGRSLEYEDWELLEAVECSGLAATITFLRNEGERRRKALN